MQYPSLGDVAVRGLRKIVVYLRLPSNIQPAKDYVEGLDERRKAKITALFLMMADAGVIRNREKFKKVEASENIWEFKDFQTRVLCFMAPDHVVALVGGETKKGDKLTPALVRQAEQMRASYFRGIQARQRGTLG